MSFRSIVTVLGALSAALVFALLTGLHLELPSSPGPAAAAPATLSIVGAPGSVSAGGPPFQVEIRVQDVTNLGAYEWQILYNSDVVELTDPPGSAIANGGFLASTGRNVLCTPPILPPSQSLQPGMARFSCGTTTALTVPGPDGNGLLSTASFEPVASGAVSIEFVCGALAEPEGAALEVGNVDPCVSAVVPTATATVPGGTPQPTATPPTMPAGTGTPPAATATSAAPTATPVPQGPTPTPEPTPPPESAETVSLFSGCNPVVSTYRDGTTVQTLANAIAPPESLESMWRFVSGVWSAYSPAFPQASNLRSADFLDVVFLCEAAPGSFVRPLV